MRRSTYKPQMRKYLVRHTDAIDGKPAFTWTKRFEIEVPHYVSDHVVIRKAKEVTELTGMWSKTIRAGRTTIIKYYKRLGVITLITPIEDAKS